jgi:hypothetical protein
MKTELDDGLMEEVSTQLSSSSLASKDEHDKEKYKRGRFL